LSSLPADFAGFPGQLLLLQPQLGPISNDSSSKLSSIPFCSKSDYTDTDDASGSACVESAAAPLFDDEVAATLMQYAAAVIDAPSLMQLGTSNPDDNDSLRDNSGASFPVVKEKDQKYSQCDPDFICLCTSYELDQQVLALCCQG
jgi:hypothetical protein